MSNVIVTSLASVMTNKRYKQHKKANCFISVKVVVSFSSPDLEQLAFLFMGIDMGVLVDSINNKYGHGVNVADIIRSLLKQNDIPKIALMLNVSTESVRRFCNSKSIVYYKKTNNQKTETTKTKMIDGVMFFWCIDCGDRPLSLKHGSSEVCTRCAKSRRLERL